MTGRDSPGVQGQRVSWTLEIWPKLISCLFGELHMQLLSPAGAGIYRGSHHAPKGPRSRHVPTARRWGCHLGLGRLGAEQVGLGVQAGGTEQTSWMKKHMHTYQPHGVCSRLLTAFLFYPQQPAHVSGCPAESHPWTGAQATRPFLGVPGVSVAWAVPHGSLCPLACLELACLSRILSFTCKAGGGGGGGHTAQCPASLRVSLGTSPARSSRRQPLLLPFQTL